MFEQDKKGVGNGDLIS